MAIQLQFPPLNLKGTFEVHIKAVCEASVKLEEISRENARRRDNCASSLFQFLSLFHNYVPDDLRKMGTEQARQMVRARIAAALYCSMYENVSHMFHLVWAD